MTKKRPPKTRNWKLGRPARDSEKTRNNRVVTFVTNSEREKLYRIAEQEERSVSWIVHRVLSEFLKGA